MNGNNDSDNSDVLVIGGSVSGLAAGLFTARHGLDTIVLQGGHTTLLRCSVLENYLGVPHADPGEFLELAAEQARDAGCRIRGQRVETLRRDGDTFEAVTSEGTFAARYIVLATGSENEYLQSFEGGVLYNGEVSHENRSYHVPCDDAGRTPVEAVYAAGRLAGTEHQALVAAGSGARAGMALARDAMADRGFPEEIIERYHDWTVHPHRYEDWDFDSWFERQVPDDVEDERFQRLKRRYEQRIDGRIRDDEQQTQRQEQGEQLLREYLLTDAEQ